MPSLVMKNSRSLLLMGAALILRQVTEIHAFPPVAEPTPSENDEDRTDMDSGNCAPCCCSCGPPQPQPQPQPDLLVDGATVSQSQSQCSQNGSPPAVSVSVSSEFVSNSNHSHTVPPHPHPLLTDADAVPVDEEEEQQLCEPVHCRNAKADEEEEQQLCEQLHRNAKADKEEEHCEHLDAQVNDADEDPLLQVMPGTNGFMAYQRANISTFYQHGLFPQQGRTAMTETRPDFTGQATKFINLSPNKISWWLTDEHGVPVTRRGIIVPWGSNGETCFPGQQYSFTVKEDRTAVLCRFTVQAGTAVYYFDPYESSAAELLLLSNSTPSNTTAGLARGVLQVEPRSLGELAVADRQSYDSRRRSLEFAALYKNFTGGNEWLAEGYDVPPHHPPHFPMWRADHFGQTRTVATEETHFQQIPVHNTTELSPLSIAEMKQARNASSGQLPYAAYRSTDKPLLNLTLRTVSCAPRVFEIDSFLSEAEVDYLLALAQRHAAGRKMRIWSLMRKSDPVLNVIYRRIASVLRIDEALLRRRSPSETTDGHPTDLNRIREDFRILHYGVGQSLEVHHDFEYPRPRRTTVRRAINFAIYLNDVVEGGETSFPRWRHAEATGESLKVQPVKGKAVLFYSIQPDGNLDMHALHAGLPVVQGEKYFANLFISAF